MGIKISRLLCRVGGIILVFPLGLLLLLYLYIYINSDSEAPKNLWITHFFVIKTIIYYVDNYMDKLCITCG